MHTVLCVLIVSVLLGIKVVVEVAVDGVASFSTPPNLIDLVTCFDVRGNYAVFLREKALWWSFACKYVGSATRCMICNNECQDLSLLHADSGPCFSLLTSRRHPLHRWDPSHAKLRWNSTMFDSRDGASTTQMYSSTSTITLNMHEYKYEYEYSENKCTRVRVRLLYNILEYEYDYFWM